MSLRLNRPEGGGLVPHVPAPGREWRDALRSRAWRPGRRNLWERQTGLRWGVRALANPVARPLTPRVGGRVLLWSSVLAFVALAVLRLLGVWA